MKLTKQQRHAIEDWVAEAQQVLRLQAWTIRVQHRIEDDDDADTSVYEPKTSGWTTLRVHVGFLALRPEERRQALAHELVHLLLRDVSVTHGLLTEGAPRTDVAVWDWVFETAVDGVADVLVPLLPPAPF